MNNIKIFIFVSLLCIYYNLYFSNIFYSYQVPHFSSSFKPINNYTWETSQINLLLGIKLYGIYLLAINKTSIFNVFFHIFMLETISLVSCESSSFILHTLISIVFYYLLKLFNKKINLKI
jgi:hypothetical protein